MIDPIIKLIKFCLCIKSIWYYLLPNVLDRMQIDATKLYPSIYKLSALELLPTKKSTMQLARKKLVIWKGKILTYLEQRSRKSSKVVTMFSSGTDMHPVFITLFFRRSWKFSLEERNFVGLTVGGEDIGINSFDQRRYPRKWMGSREDSFLYTLLHLIYAGTERSRLEI